MTRYRTDEEIRRYDLMKLGVLLLLLALLALTWYATRDQQSPGLVEAEATAPAGEESVAMPEPTLGIPAVDAPSEPIPAGPTTLSGTAGPGAQIIILVDGQPAGGATAGVDGAWSAVVDLPDGDHVIQAQTVDNVGAIVGESQPIAIVVGGDAPAETTSGLDTPEFDPVTGAYNFSGMAAPGQTVIILANGAAVGTTVADEAGNWSIAVPADTATGDISLQALDAAGNVTLQSEPVKLGLRPPSLDPPGTLLADPNTGETAVPLPAGPSSLAGRGEPGTSVELIVDGESVGMATVNNDGSWSVPVELADGTYTVQLILRDPAGDELTSTAPFTVVAGSAAAGMAAVPTAEPGAAETPASPAATEQSIADLLASDPEFSTLLSFLQTAGLFDTLTQGGPFTAFAPTNEAFATLPQQVIDGLLANPQILSEVLRYHIARGQYLAADLLIVQPTTVNERLLTITPQGDSLAVNDALVTRADIPATNGVVHAIDRILVPPLAPGVQPPVIDESGVPTFFGSVLTIVGTAEPNRTILVELNGEPFGAPAIVDANGAWSVVGDVTPGDYSIVAYMLSDSGALEVITQPVPLQVR